MNKLILLSLCVWTLGASAAKIEYFTFDDQILVGSRKLVLNGTALKSQKKGKKVLKDYVAALYLPSHSSNAAEIIKNDHPKILEIIFMRELDRESIQEAWEQGFKNNCKADCESAKDQFKAFQNLMVDVQANNRMKMSFDRTGVSVEIKGMKSGSAVLDGEAIRRSLMAIFLGEKPPTPELKEGLLASEKI